MRKPYRNQRWGQCSNTDAHAEKTLVTQQPTNYVTQTKFWGVMVLLVLGLVVLIKEVCRPEIILDPIEIPQDIIKKSGYTGIAVAEQLADAALNIELETQNLSVQNSWHKDAINMSEIETSTHIPDISVPGSPFTIRSIARFIRQELGLPADHLRGEIIHDNNGLTLTLRNISQKVPAVRISKKGIEQLLHEGGAALLQLTNPSALAMYAYHKFNSQLSDTTIREANYTKAEQLFKYCLKYPPTTDDPLVLNLWGNALIDSKSTEKALEKFHRAIKIDPDYAYSYNGWGVALLKRKTPDPEGAIKQFSRAIDIDPQYAKAYYHWGYALLTLETPDPEGAIEQFSKAIDIDPQYVDAYTGWGLALLKRKTPDPEGAIKQFSKAIDIDPEYARAYDIWGLTLLKFMQPPDPEGAIKQFSKAIDSDPTYTLACDKWKLALKDLKHPEEATKEYNKACESAP